MRVSGRSPKDIAQGPRYVSELFFAHEKQIYIVNRVVIQEIIFGVRRGKPSKF